MGVCGSKGAAGFTFAVVDVGIDGVNELGALAAGGRGNGAAGKAADTVAATEIRFEEALGTVSVDVTVVVLAVGMAGSENVYEGD